MNDKLIQDLLTPSEPLEPIPASIRSSGGKLSGIRAVIFDIYGTLLISGSGDIGVSIESRSPESFKQAFRNLGINDYTDNPFKIVQELFFSGISEEHERLRARGYPSPEVNIVEIWADVINNRRIQNLLPGILSITPEIIAAAYESTVNPVYPMPGMKEALESIKKAGLQLGIVSNAQFYTPVIFNCLFKGGLNGLGFSEDLTIFSYIEKRAKPDIRLFNRLAVLLEKKQIFPGEVVFVGNDMLKDIMPASVSGFKTILFAGDKRSLRLRKDNAACKDIKPDGIINNLGEIIDFIQEG